MVQTRAMRSGQDNGAPTASSPAVLRADSMSSISSTASAGTKEARSRRRLHRSAAVLLAVFVAACGCMYLLIDSLPDLPADEAKHVRLPTTMEQLRDLARVLKNYRENYFWSLLLAYCSTYIFLQAFALPGSSMLSLLGGSLFGQWLGLEAVCFCATTGAGVCYYVYGMIGKPIVRRLIPDRLESFRHGVEEHRDTLPSYMLALRISPVFPNWLINMSAGVVGVPFPIFYVMSFIGYHPAAFIITKAGLTLEELGSATEVLDAKALLTLAFLAIVAALPALLKDKKKAKEKKKEKLK